MNKFELLNKLHEIAKEKKKLIREVEEYIARCYSLDNKIVDLLDQIYNKYPNEEGNRNE